MKLVLGLLGLLALVPVASACEGLSPGDEVNAGGARCTLAFLLADVTGLYFATAGHCIQEGEQASSPGVGDIGVGALHYLVPENGNEQDGQPGDDFGLILVHEDIHDQLNPKVCELDGPTGIYEATPGSGGVRHHGYGLLLGDLSPTRSREGYNLINNNTAFYWTGAGVPGDSGSSVIHESGQALGVLTHLSLGAKADTNGGTHLHRGLQLAKELKGLDLRLVLQGEDPVAVLAELRAAAENETPATTPPSPTNATNPTPTPTRDPPRTTPGSVTPPPAAPSGEEGLAPAANVDEKPTPGNGVAIALLAGALVAAMATRRRLAP